MGCTFSGLNALYDSTNVGGDVWINENRFKIVRQLGEGGFAYVYMVKEAIPDSSSASAGGLANKVKDPSHLSDDGTYAMKKVFIQSNEHLEFVREEIRVSSLFNHRNLLPLLDHAIISVQLCAGLQHMHSLEPPYAHNDVKPGNVLITRRKGETPLTKLMDFGSARPARKQIRSRSEALQLQEWASEHCAAPFRAPELWDCSSHTDIDERTDIWSLGCTLYAIMYGVSPFEHALEESGGSLQLTIANAQKNGQLDPNRSIPKHFTNS
ncbi:Detected protein of confused Function [Hibiscus syriacus]|uniref:non-specific serine/threonine protein kinase n=1 Tax=Hibiscus syriacus TaxID=106335 RepID=A0A6A2YYP5_HIBSY|nr:Detected protein of confused Function [Hibiscus syriacus]